MKVIIFSSEQTLIKLSNFIDIYICRINILNCYDIKYKINL